MVTNAVAQVDFPLPWRPDMPITTGGLGADSEEVSLFFGRAEPMRLMTCRIPSIKGVSSIDMADGVCFVLRVCLEVWCDYLWNEALSKVMYEAVYAPESN